MDIKVSASFYDPEKDYTGTSSTYKFDGKEKVIKETKKFKRIFTTKFSGTTYKLIHDEEPFSIEERYYKPLEDTVVLVHSEDYCRPDVTVFRSERDLLNHLMTKCGCIPTDEIYVITTDNVEISDNITRLFEE